MNDPQYFQYEYTQSGDQGTFECIARGDLDGDGSSSTFRMLGGVASDGNKRTAVYAPNIDEANPDE
jgi:hypothetical protein